MWFQKPPLGTPLDFENPLNDNTMMHLAMNEGHGDVVRDLSGHGNHGTMQGFSYPPTVASGWNPGQTGRGLNWDGTNDYIDCGNDESLQITGSFSASVWFNPTVWNDGTNGYQPIIAKHDYGTKGWFVGREWNAGRDGIDFRIYHGDGTKDGSGDSGNIEALKGTWIHVVGVFEAGNYVKTYINGAEVYSDNTVAGSFVDADTNFLQVGRRLGSIECFTGSIDQPRIVAGAWTAKQCKDYAINPWQVYLDEDDY